MPYAIAVHGGAGLTRRDSITPEREAACREVLLQAIDAGSAVLAAGGDALDACVAAVTVLEDSPLFNAGRGAVYAADGTVQMDASVMHGADRTAGGVAAVRGIKNPVQAANLVRTQSGHVLLVGPYAEAFAAEQGAELRDAAYFHTEDRWNQLQMAKTLGRTALDHALDDALALPGDGKGTVGAVALDQHGHLAAATSTGGMTNKRPGRVGDSPLIGSGTYADDATCAVSATGDGEKFIRAVAAARVSHLMELAGLSLAEAAERVVHQELPRLDGVGGLIAIDGGGRIVMPFNSGGMYRGFRDTEQRTEIHIW